MLESNLISHTFYLHMSPFFFDHHDLFIQSMKKKNNQFHVRVEYPSLILIYQTFCSLMKYTFKLYFKTDCNNQADIGKKNVCHYLRLFLLKIHRNSIISLLIFCVSYHVTGNRIKWQISSTTTTSYRKISHVIDKKEKSTTAETKNKPIPS